jgi:Restriction endonuclease
MNFRDLNWENFEILVGRLLLAQGYTIEKQTKAGAIGPDFICINPDGTKTLVEVKHFRRTRFPAEIFRRFIHDLKKYKELSDAKNSLIVFSNAVTADSLRDAKEIDDLEIWDNAVLNKLLSKHPKIEQEFQYLLRAQKMASLGLPKEETPKKENMLIKKLKSIKAGRSEWRLYEDLCIEILTYAFTPPLSPPTIQSRSEDGLDRRDAIYAIRPGNKIWDALRTECRTRFVVAEFKNFEDEPGQKEVESLQQYLFPKAMRSFGILCSRKKPSESALIARRRAWVENEKLIVMLSDEGMIDLVNAKDSDNDPAEIIDAQLEEFFSVLCP